MHIAKEGQHRCCAYITRFYPLVFPHVAKNIAMFTLYCIRVLYAMAYLPKWCNIGAVIYVADGRLTAPTILRYNLGPLAWSWSGVWSLWSVPAVWPNNILLYYGIESRMMSWLVWWVWRNVWFAENLYGMIAGLLGNVILMSSGQDSVPGTQFGKTLAAVLIKCWIQSAKSKVHGCGHMRVVVGGCRWEICVVGFRQGKHRL